LDKEKAKAEKDFEHDLKAKSRSIGSINRKLPSKGIPAAEVIKLMKEATDKETETWKNGKVSGSVYYDWKAGEGSHLHLLNTAFGYYSISNPLHPDIWPSAMKFEAEIISMTASLVNGGNEEVCGSTTSVSYLCANAPVIMIKMHHSSFMMIGRHREHYFGDQIAS
jgi:sphinganine-1-phosphate aldolase